ncbi:MAG: VanW family protein [Brumimicrobium sp.]
MTNVHKPKLRSPLRRLVGKEYFILRRRLNWIFGSEKWARQQTQKMEGHSVFKHQSMILRPLKDVDMYLQENKRTNLKIAVAKLNNTLIKSGETFSIWKQVGRPTKYKGYLEGLVLNQGKIDKDTGGELCQLGNLLFWIFAHSPLTVVERHRHGFDVFPDVNRKVPFGAGATLSYNYIDLQVKNERKNQFKIKLWLDETHLHGELISSEKTASSFRIEERNHIMNQQIWGGYTRHNQIVKVEIDEFENETESLLVENHAIMMYSPFLQEKNE